MISEENGYFDLFDEYNKLRTISLSQEQKLFPGSLVSSFLVREELSEELKQKLNLSENLTNNFQYKVISPDGNFTKECEAIIRRKNKSKGFEK